MQSSFSPNSQKWRVVEAQVKVFFRENMKDLAIIKVYYSALQQKAFISPTYALKSELSVHQK